MTSIFDGWKKKIEWALTDGEGGFCARGWIMRQCGIGSGRDWRQGAAAMQAVESRIGSWIIANLPVPELYRECPGACIAWANNGHHLDIEGFRMVDLLTQGYVPEEPEPVDPPTIIIQPEIPTVEPVPLTEPEPELDPVAERVLVG